MTRLVGLPAARPWPPSATVPMRPRSTELLALRPHARLMTGSAAQRDMLELTLIEAALRDRQHRLAGDLLAPRLKRKPSSPQIRRDLRRCSSAGVSARAEAVGAA